MLYFINKVVVSITLYEVLLAFNQIDHKLKEMELTEIGNTEMELDQYFSRNNIEQEKQIRDALFLDGLPTLRNKIEDLINLSNKAYINTLHKNDRELKNSLKQLYLTLDEVLHNLNKYNK